MYRPLRRIASLLLPLMLWAAQSASFVHAQPLEATDQAKGVQGLRTPTNWTVVSRQSHEELAPGFGQSTGYRGKAGIITVYSYTLGFNDWQESVADSRLKGQMEEVRATILQAERQGMYRDVELEPVKSASIANHEFLFFESRLVMHGVRVWSATLLTVRNGKLLKLRMSTGRTPVDDPRRTLFEFVEELLAKP